MSGDSGTGGSGPYRAPINPEDGHTFRITVASRTSSSVVGLPGHTDADWWGEPNTVEVRAWDLPSALTGAAVLPLLRWYGRGSAAVVVPREVVEHLLDWHNKVPCGEGQESYDEVIFDALKAALGSDDEDHYEPDSAREVSS